jgi:hypothetical protein
LDCFVLSDKTPYEALTSKKPDISNTYPSVELMGKQELDGSNGRVEALADLYGT